MIDFREEINKYTPILELEQVAEAAKKDELKDVMDILQHITNQLLATSREQKL